jgi:hypothetical protein
MIFFSLSTNHFMNKRPVSVTVIAWIILVTSAFSLAAAAFTINNPMTQELMAKTPVPVPVQYSILFFGLLISVVSAIFMLRGANWARMLYIVWGAIGLLFGLFTSPAKLMLIPGILIYAIFVFFLLRPKASEYFTGSANVQRG